MRTKRHRLKNLIPPIPAHWIGIRKGWQLACQSLGEALVSISPSSMRTHALVIGSTGSGKTNLIHHLCVQDLVNGHALVVLDARGDLAMAVLELAARVEVDPARIEFLNLREKDHPTGFNPLHGEGEPYYRALGVLDAVEAESDSWGVQLSETLRNAVLLLAESKGNLTQLEALFYQPHVRRELMQRANSEPVLSFWKRYNGLTPEKQASLASPVLNKVSLLFATDTLRRIFGHPNPIDLTRQLSTPGSVTLVSLAVDELHSAGWMTGSLFLSSLCREIFSRTELAESERVPVRLVVDEFEHFGMKEFESILAEGRRFKFSVLLAHQTLAQLSAKMRAMILGNVGVKAVFRTARQDADILGRDLVGNTKELDLPSLPVGEAIVWQRGMSPIHVEVNAPIIHDVGHQSSRVVRLLRILKSRNSIIIAKPPPAVEEERTNEELPGANLEEWL